MKKIILLLTLILTISCSRNEPSFEKEQLLFGIWRLVEYGEMVEGKDVEEILSKDEETLYLRFDRVLERRYGNGNIEKGKYNTKSYNTLEFHYNDLDTKIVRVRELTKTKLRLEEVVNGRTYYEIYFK